MKQLIYWSLAFALFVTLMAGCRKGSGDITTAPSTTVPVTTVPTTAATTAPTTEATMPTITMPTETTDHTGTTADTTDATVESRRGRMPRIR